MSRRLRGQGLVAGIAAAIFAVSVLAAGCSSGSSVPPPQGIPEQTRDVSVFFSTGRTLVEEQRVVDDKDAYAATLKELLAARPVVNANIAIVQPTAEVRSVKFKSGVLTVDWDRDVLAFDAEPKEKVLALAAVLRTFGEFPEVRKVRFTVEGKDKGSLGGKDVQAFWGRVSLRGQPWPVLRPPKDKEGGDSSGGAAP